MTKHQRVLLSGPPIVCGAVWYWGCWPQICIPVTFRHFPGPFYGGWLLPASFLSCCG